MNHTDTEGPCLLCQAEEKGSAFPLKIRYENGQVCVVQRPEDIADGVGFKVLETNVAD